MQLRTNDKSSVLKYVRTRKHFCYKTAQNQTSYKYHILKASENFRSNKLKFQKEEKLLFVSKDFSLSFSCRHFLTLGACGGSGLIDLIMYLSYSLQSLVQSPTQVSFKIFFFNDDDIIIMLVKIMEKNSFSLYIMN